MSSAVLDMTCFLLCTDKPAGMSLEELTTAIANQSSVIVDQLAIRRAVETILEDVAVIGNHYKHKHAIA
jgi:hypothetical protein